MIKSRPACHVLVPVSPQKIWIPHWVESHAEKDGTGWDGTDGVARVCRECGRWELAEYNGKGMAVRSATRLGEADRPTGILQDHIHH